MDLSVHLSDTMSKSKKKEKEDKPVQLNMTFDEALKKALNTPIPKKEKGKKNKNK